MSTLHITLVFADDAPIHEDDLGGELLNVLEIALHTAGLCFVTASTSWNGWEGELRL